MIAKSVNKTTFLLHNFGVFTTKFGKSCFQHLRKASSREKFRRDRFEDSFGGQRRKIFFHYDAEGCNRQEMEGKNKKSGDLVTDG